MFGKKRKIFKKTAVKQALKEARSLDYNEDGSVQINVGLKSADDFFSPHSYLTYELMNPSVIEYINMNEASIPANEEISLDIYTETPTTNEEKIRIRKAVKRHHAEQLVITEKRLRRNLISGIIFSLIGVLILLAEAILYSIVQNMYIDTLLAVIGWLFLWDGIEVMLHDRYELVRKRNRSIRLMNAKVHVRKYSQKIQREYKIGDFESDEEE
ncbi:MAG: hypothetical protein IKJ33_04065 [Clostridia bacterium]|nr:hypothetical protein [Clostridia bacterium]